MLVTDAWGEPVELDELDAAGLLSVLDGDKLRIRGAERDKLRVAVQWCVLHPAKADIGVATWDPSGLPGVLTLDESLGGEGTPAVAAFTAAPFAAALNVSTRAGMALIADALDLVHRLPKIWKRVEVLEVEPWLARKVAQLTHPLTQAAAAAVDAAIAPVLHSCSFAAIERAVAHAIAVHQPELVAEQTRRDKDSWDVTLSHGRPGDFTGTSWLEATGDTLDLTALHDRICAMAADLKNAGDSDPLGARKAKALGLLGRQGAESDLLALLDGSARREPEENPPTKPRKPKTHLYLHASLTDFLGLGLGLGLGPSRAAHDDDAGSEPVCGGVERLGPVLLETIRDWVARSEATVTPVLDLAREWAVDGHDVPPRMREQVTLRDRHCVFPWCHTDARVCDCDHIVPYVPLDEGGPPGQTAPEKLAPLCRHHHRCKTSGRWSYRRRPDGAYHWTDPHGRHYLVTPSGTTRIHPD